MAPSGSDHLPNSGFHHNSNGNTQKPSSHFPLTTTTSSTSVFSRMPLEDVFEDLASRFILNLPLAELSHIERICFQVEQAHWFYEDFVRPNSLLDLPSYHLKTFTSVFFEKCEFLRAEGAPLAGWDPETAFDKFLRYKERVPVCGAIMLNEDATKVLLVRGFKSNASWSFPRGKINENELPRDCAIREVLEETGFDISPFMALVHSSTWGDNSRMSAIRKGRPSNPTPSAGNHNHHVSKKYKNNCTLQCEGDDHFIELTIREQRLRMYLITGIPDDTVFQTQTRQEIGRIAWFPLTSLPTFSQVEAPIDKKMMMSKMVNVSASTLPEGQRGTPKFYMVVPFVNDMRAWLNNNHLLTPIGQSLSTPRAPEYQAAHLQTPPHLPQHNYQVNHGHPSHQSTIDPQDEAAAVYERASRLQTFQFEDEVPPPTFTEADAVYERASRLECFKFDDPEGDEDGDEAASATPPLPNHDDRPITSVKKKKKKAHRKKSGKKTTSDDDQPDGLPYLMQHQANTDNDDYFKLDPNIQNDLNVGTAMLQKLIFGGLKTSSEVSQPSGAMTDSAAIFSKPQDNGNVPLLKFPMFIDRHQIPNNSITTPSYLPFQGTNPISLHHEVERELRAQVGLEEYDRCEPLSEADTDIVKGYDIATSYASSLSSSYRGPSTQIPSSDERNTSTQSIQMDVGSVPNSSIPVNTAQAMYSKHSHLAAPRPQPAPQQVERLLAMLQAPTPGPLSSNNQTSLLSQMLSASSKANTMTNGFNHGSHYGAEPETEHHTSADRVYPSSDIMNLSAYEHASTYHKVHPQRTDTNKPEVNHIPKSILPLHNLLNRTDQPVTNSSLIKPQITESITPRASNLLDLLMKGPERNHNHNHNNQLMEANRSVKEEERREKQEALLRQLKSLASLNFQSGGNNHSNSVPKHQTPVIIE